MDDYSRNLDESIRLDVAYLTGDVSATIDELANEAMERAIRVRDRPDGDPGE